MDNLWDYEDPISELSEDIDIPPWIDEDISPSTVAAIVQGGCDSGAYMPAVTYHQAQETMAEHGDDVFSFLEDRDANPVHVVSRASSQSWDGWACSLVSAAVELWASDAEIQLKNALAGVDIAADLED